MWAEKQGCYKKRMNQIASWYCKRLGMPRVVELHGVQVNECVLSMIFLLGKSNDYWQDLWKALWISEVWVDYECLFRYISEIEEDYYRWQVYIYLTTRTIIF